MTIPIAGEKIKTKTECPALGNSNSFSIGK